MKAFTHAQPSDTAMSVSSSKGFSFLSGVAPRAKDLVRHLLGVGHRVAIVEHNSRASDGGWNNSLIVWMM